MVFLAPGAEATLTTVLRIDCGKTRGNQKEASREVSAGGGEGEWGVVRAGLLEVVRVLVHCDVFSEPVREKEDQGSRGPGLRSKSAICLPVCGRLHWRRG